MQTTLQNRSLILSALPVLGLGISAHDPSLLEIKTQQLHTAHAPQTSLGENELRTIEASHLEVYAGCKWGKASFAPTRASHEPLSTEILALYDQMA